MIFPHCRVFVFVLLSSLSLHLMSCHHVHHICIRVRLMHPSIFPVVRFAIRHSHMHRRTPLVSFRVRVLKRSRNGMRLAKWPWYTTGRPPVKFRGIWSSFDTPTVNRITAKASFELQPNTPPKQPNNPSKSLPCSPSSDHNRVGENSTPFGAS